MADMVGERRSRINIIACAVTVGQELMKTTLDSLYPESSDDEEDGIIEEANLVEVRIKLCNRNCEVREQLYVNEIIPIFSNIVFRQHFHMSRTTYENLERRLTAALTQMREGRPMIPFKINSCQSFGFWQPQILFGN